MNDARDAEQKYQLMELVRTALAEMDGWNHHLLAAEYQRKYEYRLEEFKSVYEYLNAGGSGKNAYRHMQMEIFSRHETFFMDLFDMRCFPQLFELFEFAWR